MSEAKHPANTVRQRAKAKAEQAPVPTTPKQQAPKSTQRAVEPTARASVGNAATAQRIQRESKPAHAAPPGARDGKGPKLDDSSATALLGSLATVPASQLPGAVANANQKANGIQQREKAELVRSFPEIHRPTGLPAKPFVRPPGAEPERTEAPGPVAPGARENEPPSTRAFDPLGPLPAQDVDTDARAPEEATATSWWSWFWDRLQSFLDSLPTTDSGVNTSAGERPTVDTTGDADPAQNTANQKTATTKVLGARGTADEATQADFGEHDIFPTTPDEKLRPGYRPGGPPTPRSTAALAPPAVTPDQIAAFDQNAAPYVSNKVLEQQDGYQQQELAAKQQSEAVRKEGAKRISEATEQARTEQLAVQKQARGDVADERTRWVAENQQIQKQFESDSEKKRSEVDQKIETHVQTANDQADKQLTAAEKQAEDEKKKTEAEAERKKQEEENKPRSWWDSVKGAISSVFEAIKKVVNALFDALRWLVKKIISAAKALVRAYIEMMRSLIVGLIYAFGAALKGLVSLALSAFPGAAKRARAWIDRRVDGAVSTVNKVADRLKQATDAILDWIGEGLDKILAGLQKLYIIALSVIELLATGGIAELLKRLGYLGLAAWDGLGLVEGEMEKELLGFDLTQPLGPQMQQEGEGGGEDAAAQGDPQNIAFLLQSTIENDQVAVQPIAEMDPNDAPPEIGLMTQGAKLDLGRATEPERSTEGVMSGLLEHLPQEPQQAEGESQQSVAPEPTAEPANPDAAALMNDPEMKAVLDRLIAAKDRGDRLSAIKDLFALGLKRFWRDKIKPNLWWIIPAALLALAAFIALEVLTGGAITAALPVIMEVVGALFIGYDVARVAAGMVDYLSLGWDGKVKEAAKAFAHALAVGLVAILMFLLFEGVGKALKAGFKGLMRGARAVGRGAAALARTGVRVGRAALRGIVRGVLYIGRLAVKAFRVVAKMVSKAGTYVLEKGRLIFKGIERMWPEAGENARKLFARLKGFFGHFRGFVAERDGEYVDIFAEFNPDRILVMRVRIALAAELRDEVIRDTRASSLKSAAEGVPLHETYTGGTGVARPGEPPIARTPHGDTPAGYGGVNDPNRLSSKAQQLGRSFEEPYEFPGEDPLQQLRQASHAETKAAVAEILGGATEFEIGVNKQLCETCRTFFQRLSKHLNKVLVIADPARIWVFFENGAARVLNAREVERLAMGVSDEAKALLRARRLGGVP